jgi:hypothetical protein
MSLMDISTETEETVWKNPLERGEDDVAEADEEAEEEEGEWEEGEEGDGDEGDEAGKEEVENVTAEEESADGEDWGEGKETKKRCGVGEIAKEEEGPSKRRRA